MGQIKLENFNEAMKEIILEANRYHGMACWALNPVEFQRAMRDVQMVNKFVESLYDSDVEVHRLVISSVTDITYYLLLRIKGMYFGGNDYELLQQFIQLLAERKAQSYIEPRIGDMFEWEIGEYDIVSKNYDGLF